MVCGMNFNVGEIISMDLPTSDLELVRENEKIEDDKERGLTFHCELYDTEIVRKLAQAFLPGLSTACVNNTTGDMFRNPESVVLEGDLVSDHPYDIISNMVDDFASLKLNLFSRVSGWLLSEKREDKIDDFVQEMEISGFWLLDRREAVAQILVKNVDLKNIFHCDKKFNTAEELAEHVVNCGFRTMNCTNEGCSIVFCASHLEKHDSACPFKIIPCEQQCSENVMRREMDRHCITVCRMKSVSCPFYTVGCQSTMPHFRIQQHCFDNLLSHLLYTLKTIHKGGSEEDLKKRVDQIVEGRMADAVIFQAALSSSGGLADARDARSLILKVKDVEAKLGPLEVKVSEKVSEEPNKAGENSSEEPIEAFNKGGEESSEEDKIGVSRKQDSNVAENGNLHASKLSRGLQSKITELEIPARDMLATFETGLGPVCQVEDPDSPGEDGYETAEDSFLTEEDLKITELNLFDDDNEEENEEPVPEEKLLQRIDSHKGMKSYQLEKQLVSSKWTTGAGPRIRCMKDYPPELRFWVLENANLSPRTRSDNSSPRPDPRSSPNVPSPVVLTQASSFKETSCRSPLAPDQVLFSQTASL
ncbi:hypothetical protein DKX38_023894 [Salix brachista]|uniref:TRAF-type domain-containing protein n=1 Tax=Salix brachista TaxID=2182728 RepID=A0A5N5JR65_9ROSI|nr:hypothetical protein DKX38_023894 [Salix brachista]